MWQQFLLAGSKGRYHLKRTETAAVARGDDASLLDESRGCSRSRLVRGSAGAGGSAAKPHKSPHNRDCQVQLKKPTTVQQVSLRPCTRNMCPHACENFATARSMVSSP